MEKSINICEEDLIFFICEGASEENVLKLLVDQYKENLIFSEKQLKEAEYLSGVYRNAEKLKMDYLGLDYGDQKIILIFIVDKVNQPFKIKGKGYSQKIKDIYYIVTGPEIEMLMIHGLNRYNDYQKKKSKMSPSAFMAEIKKCKKSKIKSKEFILDFYNTETKLIDVIKIHKQKAPSLEKNSFFLADLLKES